jgi:glycosyltransferase involved in cell wall biosynthesis
VGRVAAEKNLTLLMQAFAVFREKHPGAPCVVVGDGPRLKALSTEHPEYLYLGAKTGTQLAQCYASADVFVFPSISETFGNVVLEAQAMGKLLVGETLVEALGCDLQSERAAQATLKDAIAAAEAARDYVSRGLFQHILSDTEEHIDFLETQLELIERVGLQNYCQSQMEPAGS